LEEILKIKFNYLVLFIAFFLPPCICVSQTWAKGEPKIYIYNYANFSTAENSEKTIQYLKKKYSSKTDNDGFRCAKIPASIGKKYFLPKPDEKIWLITDSKIQGTTKVKDYTLGGGAYQSDHVYFNVPIQPEFSSTNGYQVVLYLTVPPGTSNKNYPGEYHPGKIPETEINKILPQLGQVEPKGDQEAMETVTFTPTSTPVENAKLTPDNNSKKMEVFLSMDFPDEGVKILGVSWIGEFGKNKHFRYQKFVYWTNGRIYELADSTSGNEFAFDQVFQVMGKKYVVLHEDTGVSDDCIVLRVETGSMVKVATASVAYD
jgi:hypothetical protein